MNNQDVKAKTLLCAGFSLIVIVLVAIGVVSYRESHALASLTAKIYNHPLKVSNAALQASRWIVKMHMSMKDVVVADDPVSLEEHITHVSEDEKEVFNHLNIVRDLILGSEGQLLEKKTREILLAWRPIREEIIQLARRGENKKAALITQGKCTDHEFILEQYALNLTSYAHKKADGFIQQSIQKEKRFSLFIGVAVAIGSFVSVAIAFFTARQVISAFSLREKAERSLRKSENKYRYLYETMTQGVIIQDSEGRVLEANQAACKILGLSIELLLGKTAYDPRWKLIHEDGSPYDPEEMPSHIALRTGNPVENACCGVYVPEEDEYRWITIGSSPQFLEGEMQPSVTMTVFSDITGRKQAEEEKEQLINKLQDALEEVQELRGILPICCICKSIRNDEGHYERIEAYIHKYSGADFSHTICPACMKKHYPKEYESIVKQQDNDG